MTRFGIANAVNATVTSMLSANISNQSLSWGYVLTCAVLFGILWHVFGCDDL